jgi:mannobiose 2-epimerase
LEAYTNLYRVWKNPKLEQQLRLLIGIFTRRLLNPHTHHLDLFFNDNWQGRRNIESFGHDIEAAWLITEALEVLADEHLKTQVMPVVAQIAKASEEGLTTDGSMIHERTASTTDDERHWWVQCECVIGELNQYEHFNDEQALKIAVNCYQYILNNLVDYKNGEWYWSRRADGSINRCEDHAGFWKCPYHNSRMCIEMIERLSS